MQNGNHFILLTDYVSGIQKGHSEVGLFEALNWKNSKRDNLIAWEWIHL